MNMEELFGRLVLFLFLAGMIATIITPLFMLKIWLKLKQLQKKTHEESNDSVDVHFNGHVLKVPKPKTIVEYRPQVVTVAGKLAIVKAAINVGSHVTVRTYNFDAKDAYLNRRLYVNFMDYKADMAFDEPQDALTAWEDLKDYVPRINQDAVLRTKDKLEFNPPHVGIGVSV